MTTVLADFRLGLMCADSNASDEDRVWSVKKVHRIDGMLVACCGSVKQHAPFLDWIRAGMTSPPDFPFDESSALVLDAHGLWFFDDDTDTLTKVAGGREAIGSGSKGAICAYEALGFQDPAKAVRIACKHDANSRPPVRTYHLKGRA